MLARATVVTLALRVSPRNAWGGLAWVARGKRVRGWNIIYRAASCHPSYYACWIAQAEPAIIRRYCVERPAGRLGLIAGLVLRSGSGHTGAATVASLRKALGPDVQIWTDIPTLDGEGVRVIGTAVSLTEMLASIGRDIDWLLPIAAGDTVAPELASVLTHAALDRVASPAVFWDEDRWCRGRRTDPWIKPDWDPVLLDTTALIGAGLIATAAIHTAMLMHGRGHDIFNLVGLAALLSNILAKDALPPQHLPLILTHRAEGGPATRASCPSDRRGSATAVARVRDWPDITIIIPIKDRAALLQSCLAGVRLLTYAGRVSITIVDNGSVETETHALLADLARQDGLIVLPHPGAFNFAAMINHAVEHSRGDMLCLLNNDVEPIDGAWLTAMVTRAVHHNVGAVGARLLYPNGAIQHAGIAIGIGGAAGHVQKGVRPDDPRFRHWHAYSRIVSAVTAACLVVDRAKFCAVGGMDAARFGVDFNDVDLCLKLAGLGLRNMVEVEATLIHHESLSRGTIRSPESAARFARELAALQQRWRTRSAQDTHYSPLFRRSDEHCILAF